MDDLKTLVEQWAKEATRIARDGPTFSLADQPGWIVTADGQQAFSPETFARLAMQHAAEECAKLCEERAASHEEDAAVEKDERYAVYAKHERRCAAAIRERFKAL